MSFVMMCISVCRWCWWFVVVPIRHCMSSMYLQISVCVPCLGVSEGGSV